MLPIFSQSPNNWKELQKKVAKVFSDMGFDTDIEKDINTVCGKVNVEIASTYGISYVHILIRY